MHPPYKLSPIHTYHLAHDAIMETRAGWLIPERYLEPEYETERVRNGIGLIDRSDVGKLDLKGAALHGWVVRMFDTDLTPQGIRRITVADGITGICCWLRDDRGFLLVPSHHTAEVYDILMNQADERVHITDVTSVYAAMQLVGPQSRSLLHKITSLDIRPSRFPGLACVQGTVAKVPALLIRDDFAGLLSYWLCVTRDYGEFVWETVCQAGEEYEMLPFGYETYRQLLSFR